MIKLAHIVSALLFASISVAYAADAPKQPVSQGAASVNKNLSDLPNQGLKNASEQLQKNEAKVEEKRDDAKAKHKKDKHHKEGKKEDHDHDKMEHHEKMGHPGK